MSYSSPFYKQGLIYRIRSGCMFFDNLLASVWVFLSPAQHPTSTVSSSIMFAVPFKPMFDFFYFFDIFYLYSNYAQMENDFSNIYIFYIKYDAIIGK